jgi:hypothetical protein
MFEVDSTADTGRCSGCTRWHSSVHASRRWLLYVHGVVGVTTRELPDARRSAGFVPSDPE